MNQLSVISRELKILRVIPSINPERGGPMEAACKIDEVLIQSGHQVEVVCLDEPNKSFLKSYPAKVHALGPSRLGYCYNSRLVPWLRKNKQNYDVIIVNGIWQYHSFAVRKAVAGSNIPYYVFTHGMLDPWFKHTYPLKHIKKWLYWPWAEYRVLRDARAVIFTCEEERLLARQSFWLYRVTEAVTAYGTSNPPCNADDLKQEFLATHPELQGKRIVLFLSRIHEKKGCDMLLEAFARIASQDERLHLVMGGPDQTGLATALKTQAQRLGIDGRITWPGMLRGNAKWSAFYAAEVFCLPSHQENFGIVVAEALACGTPVLISNKVNIWREIEMDETGFVDEDTVEGTVRNLQRWLTMDHDAYTRMSDRAKESFIQRFHIRRAAERLLEIIRGP
ncbi:glycosyltransferase [Pseudomonas sp. BN102]|uniref:glycosyltransferase n=1 Tax=Pseudomonas sp. BN102 TaxID=2567886 RepID=UPI0024541DB0|nr:glycosyltransferase [Pseudomonas sp. BN102]